jgi:small conductance mechanosensitive channel
VAALILLHGVGITGVPRLTWDRIAEWLRGSGVSMLFIVGSALVLIRAVNLLVAGLPSFLVPAGLDSRERTERIKRIETNGRLLRWVSSALFLGIAALMVMRQAGVDLTPFLAGGAVLTVALGFGAQDFVKDIIGGLFLIVENQIRLGDVADINGKSGLVEAIRLRTTILRSLDGTVLVIPNGSIRELSNMTKDFSYCVIDVGVAYKEDVDNVVQVLDRTGQELAADAKYSGRILEPLEILGVDDFADSAVVIKIRIKTLPREQWNVGRELRRRIKRAFDGCGIEIPYPHMSVYFGEASKPFAISRNQNAERPQYKAG